MTGGKHKNARRVPFLAKDPCLMGLVHNREQRVNLRLLEAREMSAYESAMLLARLLTPDEHGSVHDMEKRPSASHSSLETPSPVTRRAS